MHTIIQNLSKMGLQKMNKPRDPFSILVIKPELKQAALKCWIDSEIDSKIKGIDLVYSDNLEDISTQLFFMGYKILKYSKRQYLQVVFYDLVTI